METTETICALGLDVGGTKIAAGLVAWPSGEILCRRTVPTAPERGGGPVLQDVIALVRQFADEAERNSRRVLGVGLGVAELVDANGRVTSGHTIRWEGLPVRETLAEVAPAVVDADVRTAALGEAWFGAGRPFNNFLYITVGTGISSCLVIGKKPWPGANGNALVMASSPLSATCGRCGAHLAPILEEFASGPAIARRYGDATDRPIARAEEVLAALDSDDRARKVIRSAGFALGVSLGFLVNVMDPEAVVVGGGLGCAPGMYWDEMLESARRHIWSATTRRLPIVRAGLGPDSGIVGAAAAVFAREGLLGKKGGL
jgi:predicted NBD/HSP70 family sugar kinase